MTEQMMGKYKVIEEIGHGGFATVYRALDTTLEREVALKVLDPLLMRDAAWVGHFRKEARTVAALDHPHIVTIHEIAEAEGRLFIAMKLINGPSLDKALAERGALPWEEILHIMREIAGALAYAHSKGVLHRDLKPGNVLLDPRTGAVLTDFGFARLVSESSMSVSLSGGLVGTPHYLAPELWHNQPASPASDLYALGCILYEMVLGRKAFPGETPAAVMTAHLLQPLALPDTWPEGVPAGMESLLQQTLAREPEVRLGEEVADLLAALEMLEVTPTSLPETAKAVTTNVEARSSIFGRSSRWLWGMMTVAGVVLVIALCVLLESLSLPAALTPTFTSTPTMALAPVATATTTATTIPTPIASAGVKVREIYTGTITFDQEKGMIAVSTDSRISGLSLSNFIAEAQFQNPYTALGTKKWNYGFSWRWHENNAYVVLIASDGSWEHHIMFTNDESQLLARGRCDFKINTQSNQANSLRLVVTDDAGQLWVNNMFVTSLDASGLTSPGEIMVTVGGITDRGSVTAFKDFTVWSLENR